MSTRTTALISGATGYIGHHLTAKLNSMGWDVHVLARTSSSLDRLRPMLRADRMHVLTGDLAELYSLTQRVQPDIVFHLASRFLVQHSRDQISDLVQSNILWATQLLDALSHTDCRKFINTGTSWEHMALHDPSPVNLYAATKCAFASVVEYYVSAFRFKAATLKLFDTYGPMDWRPKLFALLRESFERNKTISLSPGNQQLDLVYITDVVEAYVQAARYLDGTAEHGHWNFSVCTNQPRSLQDIVRLYETSLGQALPVDWGARPYREREVMIPLASEAWVPGWQPLTGLEEGIQTIVESDRHN